MFHSFSKGKTNPNLGWGSLLITKAAVLIASAQNLPGTFFACSILRQTSARCRFFLSATPFCCGVLAQVYWWCIRHFLRYWENSLELYSSLLYMRMQQIFFPTSHSVYSLNSLNFENVSDLSFIKKTHTFFNSDSTLFLKTGCLVFAWMSCEFMLSWLLQCLPHFLLHVNLYCLGCCNVCHISFCMQMLSENVNLLFLLLDVCTWTLQKTDPILYICVKGRIGIFEKICPYD